MKSGRSLFRTLLKDRRGVSAVEFALLAPVMIVLYFGLVEFCQGYMALKRTGHASSMVADLVSQVSATTSVQIDDMFAIGDLIMKPFPTNALRQRVSSVTRVNSTTYRVDWSRTKGMASGLTSAEAQVPSDMLANGETVIIAESEYDYGSPFKDFIPNGITFKRRAYLRPRDVNFIPCTGC